MDTQVQTRLQDRLTALSNRIAELRQRMSGDDTSQLAEIDELERRHKLLEEQVHSVDRQGPGNRQTRETNAHKVADELNGMVEDFTNWVDAGAPEAGSPKANWRA